MENKEKTTEEISEITEAEEIVEVEEKTELEDELAKIAAEIEAHTIEQEIESSKMGEIEESLSTTIEEMEVNDAIEEIEAKDDDVEDATQVPEEATENDEAQDVEEAMSESTEKSSGIKISKKAMIIIGAVVAALVVIYFGAAVCFSSRFLIGTSVNGVNCSGKTVKEVKRMLQSQVEEYVLTLEEADGKTEQIKGTDIGIKYNGVDVIEEAMEDQNPYLWVVAPFQKNEIKAEVDFDYNSEKLSTVIANLSCLKEENQVAPVAATPVYVNEVYEIQEEVYGTQIHTENFYSAIEASIKAMDTVMNLEENKCYVLPMYTKDSEEVIAAKDGLNKCLEASITYSLDGITVTVDKTMIAGWISVDENMAVNVNAEQVRAFTDSLGTQYNTPNSSQQITTPTGKVAEIPNARMGRIVGSAAECEQLINEILEGKQISREPLLSQTATPEGATAWGATYVEVDITAQHMWYIVDGAVAFECDVITGSPGRDTPVGLFTILEKLRNKTLRGNIMPNGQREYETPVSYWARVTWSGVGFHDATWQPAFGGEMYKQGYGSHGCINMALGSVAAFYEMVSVGCPVIIHY